MKFLALKDGGLNSEINQIKLRLDNSYIAVLKLWKFSSTDKYLYSIPNNTHSFFSQ